MSLDELKKEAIEDKKEPVADNADITKIKSDLEKSDKDKEVLSNKVAELEFSKDFDRLATEYPHAQEKREEIREKVKNGYSVEDATFAVLGREKKLVTRSEIDARENKGRDLGGSSSTVIPRDGSEKPRTLEELRQDVKDLEARGEIRISSN